MSNDTKVNSDLFNCKTKADATVQFGKDKTKNDSTSDKGHL